MICLKTHNQANFLKIAINDYCVFKKMNKEQLISEINRLKKEKNAVIMAHYYQMGDIQDIADVIGDSLALAQKAAKTDADIIVLCGVHFMGETAKILSPTKKVLVPDLNAACSLPTAALGTRLRHLLRLIPIIQLFRT